MINPDNNKEKKYHVPRRNLVQRKIFITPTLATLFQRFWGYIYIRRFMKF